MNSFTPTSRRLLVASLLAACTPAKRHPDATPPSRVTEMPATAQPAATTATPDAATTTPVALYEFCAQVSDAFCDHCAPNEPEPCRAAFYAGCIQGRDPQLRGWRTRPDVVRCVAAVREAHCETLPHSALPTGCQRPAEPR